MKKIIFKKDCTFQDQSFSKGKELDTSNIKNWLLIWKLNEKGDIEPLTLEEFRELQNEAEKNKKKLVKEGDNNGKS